MDKLLSTLVLVAILSFATGKPSFIFVGPRAYDVGTKETVALHLFNVTGNGKVYIRFSHSSPSFYDEVTFDIENGEGNVFEVPVPSIPNGITRGRLDITGLIGNYTFTKGSEITFRDPKPIVFVNTDKPLYKDGQKVNIRVLVTDRNLKPSKEIKEGDIWITDPNRIRIAQWLNVPLSQGLVHRELLLPEEPLLGRWTVYVKTDNDQHTRSFDVQEYVLPPFEVTITPPHYLLKNAKNITWEVCARYTYGKPVRGELVTRFSQYQRWNSHRPIITRSRKIEGCEEVTFDIRELKDLDSYSYYTDEFELIAQVDEEGTGTTMNSSNIVRMNNLAYTIKRQDNDISYFKPRVPLTITMEVRTPDSKPLPDELISVCMKTKREKWNDIRSITDTLRTCKNYTSNRHGYVIFTIPPQDPNTVSLEIEVEAAERHRHSVNEMRLPRDSFSLQPWYSVSGSYLQMQKLNRIDCSALDPDVQVTQIFHYTFNKPGNKKIYYQVMARGEVVKNGDFDIELNANGDDDDSTDDTYLPYYSSEFCASDKFEWGDEMNHTKHIGKFFFSLKLTPEMIPKVRLLLYTLNDNGEVVADSSWFDIDPCFANEVHMTFGEEKQLPGSKASIHLKAEPLSVCSVGVVDKSVYILNKGDRLTGNKINGKLGVLDTSRYTFPNQLTNDYTYCPGESSASHVDAMTAFVSGGGLVLTDLKLETRPCKKPGVSSCPMYPNYRPSPHNRVEISSSGIAGHPGHPGVDAIELSLDSDKAGAGNVARQPSSPTVTVRTDFPETWLFDLHTVGEEGTLTIHEDIPDSITEWQGEAVCIHSDKGLGLSKPASIVAFQPFFASLTLPYSVIRNEIAPIIVTVFNYLEDCLSIRIHLDNSEEFDLFNGTLTKDVCVCGGQSVTERFHIKPKVLGQMNVTVMAATSKNPNVCSDVTIATDVKRSDTIIKPIIVEAEGFLKEETKNTFFCMEDVKEDSFDTEYKIQVPADAVEDSARAYCLFTGDIMGPTLEGLDNLIRLPTGCGEQNMIGLVPNIVVLDYLNSTGRLTGQLKQKAINNIEQGYIREQKYRHFDGSYSAFGKNDKEGSMWLTAFVVRTFASVRRHITIDEQSLKYSRNWILSRQGSNGCFPMVGTIHHKEMKGGVGSDGGTMSTLTAYILISMLESGHLESAKVENGLRCLEAKHTPTNYSLALFAYAAILANHPSAFTYLDKLINNAERKDHYLYWNSVDKSISVETAGYAILTLLRADREGDFQNVAALARWLTNQRNPYGGFYSTQDTVVALQALGEYGARVTRQQLDMKLSITSDKVHNTYPLNEENELVTETINLKLEQPETSFHVEATGTGCALVQTLLRYNLPIPEPSKDFDLHVTTQKSKENCKVTTLHICTSYNHPDGSNMAIVEVKMVSGYVPVKNTVKELLQKTELGIRRYEIEENTVNVYFTTLTELVSCFNFQVIQEIEVLEAKPANVKVYDYYDNEKAVSASYSIGEECAL